MDNVLRKTICRACLTETSSYISLLSKIDGDGRTLRDVLSIFTNVDIIMSDKYPKHVCNECHAMLFKAAEFKKRCLQSEAIIKNGFLSHTLEDLIKRETIPADHLKVSNLINYPQSVSNSYLDNILKKDTVATNEIEISVENNYYSTDIQRNDSNYVKEERDDYVQDDINDLSDDMNVESTSIDESLIASGIARDIADLKTVKDCSEIEQKKSSVGTNEFTMACTLCREEFSTFDQLQIHLLNHKEIKNYPCSICNGNFTCKYSLKTHIKTHKVKARVKQKRAKSNAENKKGHIKYLTLICPKCDQKFSGIESFQEHIKSHKEDTESNCDINSIKLVNPDAQSYQCSLCMRKFVQRSSLVKHIKRHGDRAQVKYPCKKCKREFQHKAHLDNHIVLVHSKDQGFTCDVCSKGFATQECLDSHKDRHKVDRKHQCKVCGKCFTMLSTLTEHMKIHTGEKPYLCSVCGRGFSQKNNMHQHMRRHQGVKPFKCNSCDRGFVSKGELEAHARKHTGAHPFVCDDCGGSFTTSSSLTKHRRIHTGERPYACDLCPMRFTALNTLKNHRRTHTGEKPYQCSHCEKAFTQRNDLVSHIRCHTGERPYVCTFCGQAFRKTSALKVHIKVHGKDNIVM